MPNAEFLGIDTFTYFLRDSLGVSSNLATVQIDVVPNHAPVNVMPVAQTVDEDTALAISGLSVTDVDGNLVTTQLAVTNGTLTVDLAGGATISAGANGTNTLTVSGTQVQINAALSTLTYQGISNYSGSDTLTVTSTDSASATDVDTVAITVQPVVTTARWINPAGGDWDVASNWDVGRVPDATTDVIIDGPVSSPIVHGTGLLQVKSLTVSDGEVVIGGNATFETVSLSGGSIAFNGATTATTLTQTGGTLTGSGVVTLTGSGTLASAWSAGTVSGSGTTLVQGDLNMTVGATAPVLGRQLIVGDGLVPAHLNLTGGGLFTIDGVSSGRLTIQNHGVMTLDGEIDLAQVGGAQASSSVTVNGGGTILKLGVGTQTVFSDLILKNNGLVDIQSGFLRLAGGSVTEDGNFNVDAGATLECYVNRTGGHLFAGNGGITGNGTVVVNDRITKVGTGTTTISPTVVVVNGGNLVALNGSLVLSGTVTNDSFLGVAEGATVIISGNLTNYNPLTHTLTGGQFHTARFSIEGVLRVTDADIVTNAANIGLSPGAQFLNHTTGESALASLATNTNTFTLSEGTTFTTSGSFTNNGNLLVNTDATLTVSGTFTNTIGGVVGLSSLDSSRFSKILINGSATLSGGLLQFELAPLLQVDDRLRFMTFASRTGFFDQTEPSVGMLIDQNDPTFLELVVTEAV